MIESLATAVNEAAKSEINKPSDFGQRYFSDSQRPSNKGFEQPAFKEGADNLKTSEFSDSERPSANGFELPELKTPNRIESSTSEVNESGHSKSFAERLQAVEDRNAEYEKKHGYEDAEGNICYTDDNKDVYRVNDNLVPNNSYEINGYKYTTDSLGRIVQASGNVHIKDHSGRLDIKDSMEKVGKGDELPTDDRGHVIGDQLGGSNGIENLTPQDSSLNRGEYKNFENQLSSLVKNGNDVYLKIDIKYSGESNRPDYYIAQCSVNDERFVKIFKNTISG